MPSLVVAHLNPVSGVGEDTVNNVFTFVDGPAEANAIFDALEDFYNGNQDGGTGVHTYIGESVTRAVGGCQFLLYNLTDLDGSTDLGPPAEVRNWQMGSVAASTALPSEVAVCLTYHGDLSNIPETADNPTPPPAKIRPASRHRGRLYLGPLMENIGTQDPGTKYLYVTQVAREDITQAAQVLALTAGISWGVWSKTDAAIYPVSPGGGVFMDNAFDTQRRRGTDPQLRTSRGPF